MELTKLRTLLSNGLYFEGPRWHANRLWMVDSLARSVLKVEMGGECEKVCEINGISGGMGILPSGDLIVTSMFDRKLLRYADGRLSEHADLSNATMGPIDDMIFEGVARI